MTTISITGGAYAMPSLPTNRQRCVNMYPTAAGPEGRGQITLMPTMGNKLLVNLGDAPIRGIKGIGDYLYVAAGNKFYRMTINTQNDSADVEVIGTLDTTEGTVTMSSNPYQVILLDGVFGYIYNYEFSGSVPLGIIGGDASDTYTLTINSVAIYTAQNVSTQLKGPDLVEKINTFTASTHVTASFVGGILTLTGDDTITTITVAESGTGFLAGTDGITVSPGIWATGTTSFSQFQKITDPGFVGGSHVVYIDSYFIYNEPDTSKFYFSSNNEGRIYNAADVASAESKPDKVVALGQTKGELWVFGTDTVEVWFDAANPQASPFSKRIGSDIDIGCVAPYSVCQVNNVLMWLDSRGYLVQSDESAFLRNQSSGYNLKKVSSEAIDAEFASYQRIDDAIACSYVDRGHIMYEITFPTDRRTWVFDAGTEMFYEKNYYDSIAQEYRESLIQYSSKYLDKLVGGGIRDGKLYLMSHDYRDDDGQEIHRIRTTSPFNSDFKLIGVDRVEIKLNTGLAPQTGDGSDPKIMLKYSNDSGHTWSNELWRSIGKTGEFNKRVIWNRLGTAYEWVLELKITDPIDFSIIDGTASINIEEM